MPAHLRRLVVVGGGIAGVCCAEELCKLCADDPVLLVSASSTIKGVDNIVKHTKTVEEFEIVERDLNTLPYSNLQVLQAAAVGIDVEKHNLILEDGTKIAYDSLCIAAGAVPKAPLVSTAHVLMLRDSGSIQELSHRLRSAKRVMIVGNGGIALELAQSLQGYEIIWVMRHSHIGDAFFDRDAAEYLLGQLRGPETASRSILPTEGSWRSRAPDRAARHYASEQQLSSWCCRTDGEEQHAKAPSGLPTCAGLGHVTLEHDCEVTSIKEGLSPADSLQEGHPRVQVLLSNGHRHAADLVVFATGVVPNTGWLPPELERGPADGGVAVDASMQSSVPGIYAAGDCCWVRPEARGPQWFQMRLWTQARAQGLYVAKCMSGTADPLELGLPFELFTHVTRFCGQKVVLLGLYNGQRLGSEPPGDIVTYARTLAGKAGNSFARVLLLRGRLQGAVLLGETELEETFENLILDGIDLSRYGPEFMDPDIDLQEVFD
ncbi:hypothetical protein WJX84_006237 [Apatococcus fuscideae]|uniref:FAD/NAD(P)-binding domain-containing protein n=1 Tax=Apatococcus fuscideae TaxID=2026836 RepID=A0AAW1SU20_9CHLO